MTKIREKETATQNACCNKRKKIQVLGGIRTPHLKCGLQLESIPLDRSAIRTLKILKHKEL